ncbi:MAG: hypothetical protein ACLTQP_01010 [Faecalibacterium prausnitzii]
MVIEAKRKEPALTVALEQGIGYARGYRRTTCICH